MRPPRSRRSVVFPGAVGTDNADQLPRRNRHVQAAYDPAAAGLPPETGAGKAGAGLRTSDWCLHALPRRAAPLRCVRTMRLSR